MDNESQEMYLKVIYELEEDRVAAHTTEIAAKLGVAPASVAEMLGKLRKKGLVAHRRYSDASLTKKGRNAARRIVRKHRLLERFLHDYLKIADPAEEACRMEHVLSDDADQRLCMLMNRPTLSTENREIPHCTKPMSCQECLHRSKEVRPIPILAKHA